MKHALLLGLLILGLAPASLRAQRVQVIGHVVDSAGRPVPNQLVLLHRVAGMSGASIGQARSDSAGFFSIPVDSADNRAAVYFVAARWHNELYISDPFQAPLGKGERVLQVGVPGTSATAMLEGTGPMAPAGSGTTAAGEGGTPAHRLSWLVIFAPLVVLLGVALYLILRNRGGIPERRRLLIRIAELDLQHAASPDPAYQAERAALLSQVRELTAT